MSDDQNPVCSADTSGARALSVIGWILIALGVWNGMGAWAGRLLTEMSQDFPWLIMTMLVALVPYENRLQRRGNMAALTMLLLWIIFGLSPYRLLEIDLFGVMLTVLGGILLATNDQAGRNRRALRKPLDLALWHRGVTAVVVGVVLVVGRPDNARDLCLAASRPLERIGAYAPAIAVTELARDRFPSESWCGTCRYEVYRSSEERLAVLRWKQMGRPDLDPPPGASQREWSIQSPSFLVR